MVEDRFKSFPSSGEINFRVGDAATAIKKVVDTYLHLSQSLDDTDGFSLSFDDWRFNLRKSNTEPLVRLNIESKGNAEGLSAKVATIAKILGGSKV